MAASTGIDSSRIRTHRGARAWAGPLLVLFVVVGFAAVAWMSTQSPAERSRHGVADIELEAEQQAEEASPVTLPAARPFRPALRRSAPRRAAATVAPRSSTAPNGRTGRPAGRPSGGTRRATPRPPTRDGGGGGGTTTRPPTSGGGGAGNPTGGGTTGPVTTVGNGSTNGNGAHVAPAAPGPVEPAVNIPPNAVAPSGGGSLGVLDPSLEVPDLL